MTLALVLGGGGVAGIAWHTGVLLGLSERGADPSGADVLIGTSAGSTVAAQVGCGHPLDELFARQVDPATLATERTPPVAIAELIARMAPIFSASVDATERRKLLGAMALDTETVDHEVRRAVVEARLAGDDWPDRPLYVPVVEATTGERRVLERFSGVDLVDAVAASSAVPGLWPPVTLGGARYIDGGVWSLTNSDLAAGHDRVLVLAPIVDPSVAAELADLGPEVRSEVVRPDVDSLAAFGSDVLDPVVREPSARAGLAQGRAEADRVRDLLTR
jgi:NTE family protein